MIYGIGVDIVETERIQHSLERFGEKFLERVYREGEVAYCQKAGRPEIHFAARFAAKEAVAKALGTGFGEHLEWTDVEVIRAENGKPSVLLHGTGKAYAESVGIEDIYLSISHSDHYAVAHAVAVSGKS